MAYLARLLVAALLFASVVRAGRHAASEIFNGALYYVNTSTIQNGVWVNTGVGKIGNIVYAPAYPGALFGNMSVGYGTPFLPTNSECMTVLSDFSGYTGGYRVFPEANPPYIEHYPIVNSNVINGNTQAGLVAKRFFQSFEDDNLVFLGANPANSRLFWRRNFPFPSAGSSCTATASVQATGNSWVSGGATYQQYSLKVTNIGDAVITAVDVVFNFGGEARIDSSWNISPKGANTYSVALPAGLAIGSTSSSSGFIVRGSGSVTVSAPPSATVCN
jgi:hypothetical protein